MMRWANPKPKKKRNNFTSGTGSGNRNGPVTVTKILHCRFSIKPCSMLDIGYCGSNEPVCPLERALPRKGVRL
ncbi:hypothetical protein Ga0451573_001243 [Peptococcaceae bacterium DYL19]|nr:hypothetical protein [Phosphitispora fastidiosa]